MKPANKYKLRLVARPLERFAWRVLKRIYPRYDVGGIEVVDRRGDVEDSRDVRDAVAEALAKIRDIGGSPLLPSVVAELAFVAAVDKNERISENLRGYFWVFSGRAGRSETDLALGIIGAAGYLQSAREAREKGSAYDVGVALDRCHSLQEEFARRLPDADTWLRRIRDWRASH
jgi:hypothetical protein